MPTGFSAHNPTAHLQKSSSHECCGCSGGHMPQMSVPDPTPLDELIRLYDLSVDSETHKVSLITKDLNTKEQKLVQHSLQIINALSHYLSQQPFPHCPPAPAMVEKNARSNRINSMKEEGNAAIKSKDFQKAIEIYTQAAEVASTRPLFEPWNWMEEDLRVLLCNRSAAYCSAEMWIEALCDAEAVIQLNRRWCKGYFRRAKALQGLGRIDDAKDAILTGLEFDPHHPELQVFLTEISA